MSTTNHTFAGTEHSRLCDCRHPLRPHGHEPTCLHYRPLRDWTDAELAIEADRLIAERRTNDRAFGRACRRARLAHAYWLACLAWRSRVVNRLDAIASLASAIRKERAAREAAPKAGEFEGKRVAVPKPSRSGAERKAAFDGLTAAFRFAEDSRSSKQGSRAR